MNDNVKMRIKSKLDEYNRIVPFLVRKVAELDKYDNLIITLEREKREEILRTLFSLRLAFNAFKLTIKRYEELTDSVEFSRDDIDAIFDNDETVMTEYKLMKFLETYLNIVKLCKN